MVILDVMFSGTTIVMTSVFFLADTSVTSRGKIGFFCFGTSYIQDESIPRIVNLNLEIESLVVMSACGAPMLHLLFKPIYRLGHPEN